MKTIKFYKNDGTDSFYAVTYEKGQQINLGDAPTRPGYTFNGYFSSKNNLKKNQPQKFFRYENYEQHLIYSNKINWVGIIGGSGNKEIGNNMEPCVELPYGNVYACWVPNEYRIKFDYNNGTGDYEYQVVIYGESIVSPKMPTRPGYKFGHYETPNDYFYLIGLEHWLYLIPYNATFIGRWIIDSPAYLDFINLGKVNGQWKIKIINTVDTKMTITYNSKMCNFGDAKNWTGLLDTETLTLAPNKSVEVLISENWFATSITASWVINNIRYITYADHLSTGGGLTIYHNSV